jgi:hypothetical protein
MAKYEYKASMAEEIIRMSKEGYLKVEIASALGVPQRMISVWKREIEEFAELMELAETHSAGWWAMRGRTNLDNPRFNFYIWYAIMKNAYGWADKPTERNIEFEEWKGTFIDKINNLDQMLASGKCSTDMYEKMMKSLSAHAGMNEILYIQPEIAKMELERQLKDGTINDTEYTIKMVYLDRTKAIRDLAAENIFKEEKLYSKFNSKQERKVPKNSKENKRQELENTQVTIAKQEPNPLFEKQVKEIREKRMRRLGLNKDGTTPELPEEE